MAKSNEPAEGVTYTKPTTQLDLEEFQAREAGNPSPSVGEARAFGVEGNDLDAFVGTSPEYANYADETHKALAAEGDGAEAKAEAAQIEAQAEVGTYVVPSGVDVAKANADLGGEGPPADEPPADADPEPEAPAPAKE